MEDYDYDYNSDYENNDYDNDYYIDEEGYNDNYERSYRGHHGGWRWFASMDRDEERRIAAEGHAQHLQMVQDIQNTLKK